MLAEPASAIRRAIALVIDDAPETLGFVSTALEENGMTVLVARSGHEGVELANRVQPDVILLDAIMPGLDGFETCKILKSRPASQNAPVIFMTGMSDSEHILRGLSAGGVDYITKPVVVDELIARITRHVLNARAINSARVALEYAGQSVLAFGPEGQLSWGTPSALQMLKRPGGDLVVIDAKAQGATLDWLLNLPNQPISGALPHIAGDLTLVYLGQANGETVIRIRDGAQFDDVSKLARAFAITNREAEVLLWLSHGKTNRDIADILNLSARTVNKHLEQVFHKMGVDNRTSAAVLADRILQV